MKTAMKGLLAALLALPAIAPGSAEAARNPKTAFAIVLDGVARLEQFPTNYPEFSWDFHASGAISDGGPAGGGYAQNEWLLQGRRTTYLLIFTTSSDFEIYDLPDYQAYPGKLLGSGTLTSYKSRQSAQWWRVSYQLEGTLVGG